MAKVHHLCWIWHRFPITDIVRSVGRIQKSNRDGNGKGSMLNLRGEESKETTDWSKWHYHTISQSKYMSILLQDWSFLTSMAYLNLSWGFFTRFRHLLPLAGLLAWAHRHLKFKVTEKSRCIVAHRCSWWYARGNKKSSDSMNSRVANAQWQNLLHDGRLYVWWMRKLAQLVAL